MSDEQQIRRLVEAWMEASISGDVAAVLGLMSDDVVFLIPGQPPMIGKQAFAAAMQSPPDHPRPDFQGFSDIQEIHVAGDFAYMWTKLKVVVTPPGNAAPITRIGHTLSVLRKENGAWLLIRDANLLVPTQTD